MLLRSQSNQVLLWLRLGILTINEEFGPMLVYTIPVYLDEIK